MTGASERTPQLFVVRAEYGRYAQAFRQGGYVAIGWIGGTGLDGVTEKGELYDLYRAAHPGDTSPVVIGQQVGQIARFLLELRPGDYVMTPTAETDRVLYGRVLAEPGYTYAPGDPACPYPHRRAVAWANEPLLRSTMSVPFQNTIRSSLTIFRVGAQEEFFAAIGKADFVAKPAHPQDPYAVVLDRVLLLDDKEFEILITHLLAALGFEGAEHTGKTGDGGVDATGELNLANLARVKLFVQAKRYKPGTRITANTVRALRQAIPVNGQGAFITTADYQPAAHEVATQTGFPRIGLVNGRQLVDLLVEHWDDIPEAFREQLGLRPGLVLA